MKSALQRLYEYKFRKDQLTKSIKWIKKELKNKEEIYGKLCEQVSWPTMILLTIAFVASVFLEVVMSFDMYLDLAARNISEFVSPYIVSIFLIVLVIILAAFAAHKLRLFWCNDLRLVEETLYIEKNYSQSEASIEVKRNGIKGAAYGFIIAGTVLTMVYFISIERISLLSVIDETVQFSFIEVLLPVIMVLLEIICGTHLVVAIKLIGLKIKVRSLKKQLYNAEHNKLIMNEVISSCEELIENEKNRPESSEGDVDEDDGLGDFLGLSPA